MEDGTKCHVNAFEQAAAWKRSERGNAMRDSPLYSLNLVLMKGATVNRDVIRSVLTEDEVRSVMRAYDSFQQCKGQLLCHAVGKLSVPMLSSDGWTAYGKVATVLEADGSLRDVTPASTVKYIEKLQQRLRDLQQGASDLTSGDTLAAPSPTDFNTTGHLLGAVMRKVHAESVTVLPFGLNDDAIGRLSDVMAVRGTDVIVDHKTRARLDSSTKLPVRYAADTRKAYEHDREVSTGPAPPQLTANPADKDEVVGALAADVACVMCNKAEVTDDNDMAACDDCSKSYHVKCIQPHYETVPKGLEKFYCPACFISDGHVEFLVATGKRKRRMLQLRGRVRVTDLPPQGVTKYVQVHCESDAVKEVAVKLHGYALTNAGALPQRAGAFRVLAGDT